MNALRFQKIDPTSGESRKNHLRSDRLKDAEASNAVASRVHAAKKQHLLASSTGSLNDQGYQRRSASVVETRPPFLEADSSSLFCAAHVVDDDVGSFVFADMRMLRFGMDSNPVRRVCVYGVPMQTRKSLSHELTTTLPASGQSSEAIEVNCTNGTFAYLIYPIRPAALIEEF